MRATLDFTDDLTGEDLAELTEAARSDGRTLGRLLKDAALSIVQVRKERRALVSPEGTATPARAE